MTVGDHISIAGLVRAVQSCMPAYLCMRVIPTDLNQPVRGPIASRQARQAPADDRQGTPCVACNHPTRISVAVNPSPGLGSQLAMTEQRYIQWLEREGHRALAKFLRAVLLRNGTATMSCRA